jgi:hypothetical protein
MHTVGAKPEQHVQNMDVVLRDTEQSGPQIDKYAYGYACLDRRRK